MYKKVLSLIVVLCLAISLIPTSALAAEIFQDEILLLADEDDSTPELDGTTYRVKSASELLWVATSVSSGNSFSGYTIELISDIDLKDTDWISIGYNLNNYFSGIFDGKNHIVKNYELSGNVDSFSIVNAPRHTAGFFGVCKNAIVKNLYIENATVSISNDSGYSNSYSSINGTCVYGGAVCGYSTSSTFQNIVVRNSSVTVYTGSEAAYAYGGGICGFAEKCNFIHCGYESGSVTGTSQSLNNDACAGGIVGELVNEAVVRQCYNTSNVYGGHSIAAAYTGGIAGKTSNSSATLSTIRDCYNQGTIFHSGSWLENAYIGGIIGYSSSTVNRCYNSGVIRANTNTVSEAHLGGIAGSGISSSSVSNSAVITQTISGGTARYIIAGAGGKDNNIAYSGLSGSNDANSRYAADAFFGSDIYANNLMWDFNYIWVSESNNYPTLKYVDADNEADIQAVDEAAGVIQIIFASGDSYNKVTQNIGLPKSPNTATVIWTSSNESVVSSKSGMVSRQNEDYQVKMAATITSGNYSVMKTFILNVVGTNTGTVEPIIAEEWGLSLDNARSFVALMRGVHFKDVAIDDPDVQVLVGANIEEDAVAATLANVMNFWEVPEESAYLKSQMGDIIGYFKSGEDEVISSLVSDVSGGLVSWDSENGTAKLDKKNIAKMFLKIDEGAYNTVMEYVEGYQAIKGIIDYEADLDSPVTSALDLGDKVGNVFEYVVTYSGPDVVRPSTPSLTCGKISGWIKTGKNALQIMDAWNKEMKNSVKAYLKLYNQNRANFDSADDESFKLTMNAVALTNFTGNEETLNTLAETLYQLNLKFGGNIADEYKIVIKCPVDVAVYDTAGKIVGRVVNNKVDTSIANSLYITVGGENNDEKTIYIQDNETYTLSLTGNDSGTMNVSVENTTENLKETYDYNDISLEDGKEMTFSISSDDLNEEPPMIYVVEGGIQTEEVEVIDNEKEKYLFTAYPCIENVDGKVEISSIGGNCVTDYIMPGTGLKTLFSVNDGYILEGLYTNSDCTLSYTERNMPAGELTLYAKFIINNSGIIITKQPKDGEYYVNDEAEALSVIVKNADRYQYQWYICDQDKENAKMIPEATSIEYIPDTSLKGTHKYYVKISYQSENETITLDSDMVVVTVSEKELLGSGDCGNGVLWKLAIDGKLVISGNGKMDNYTSGDAPWQDFSEKITEIVVEDGVESIGDYAFYGCASLKNIKIADTVETIGEYVLNGCHLVEAVTIPFVGSNRDAIGTKDAVLGHLFGIAHTGTAQFYSIAGASMSGYNYAIPDTLSKVFVTDAKHISFGAFYNCSALTEIKLNKDVNFIGGCAFRYCTGLSEIDIPESVVTIEQNAFDGCSSLTKIVLNKQIETIGNSVFAGCVSLEELTIPFIGLSRDATGADAVLGAIFGTVSTGGIVQYYEMEGTSLHGYQYGIPERLRKVVVTNANKIPFGAFCNCFGLDEIVLNEGIKTVEQYGFKDCTGLTDIIIPNSVAKIEEYALNGCNSLKNITIPFVGAAEDSYNTNDAVFGFVFGRGSEGVRQYFKLEGSSLSWSLYEIPASLETVTITREKELSVGAFSSCSSLKNLYLNAGITSIGVYAFYDCTGLTDVYYDGTMDEWKKIDISGSGNGSLTSATIHFKEVVVSNIQINEDNVFVERGKTQQFTANLEGPGSVIWSIDGNESRETMISSDGLLRVSLDESSSFINVTVEAEQDSTKKAVVTVSIVEPEHMHTYSSAYQFDMNGHWQECACGEATETTKHTFGDWSIEKEATCTEVGERVRSCTICGYDAKETIDAVGHILEKTDEVEADCTNAGLHAYWSCSKCSRVFSDAEGKIETTIALLRIEPAGHNYENEWLQDEREHYHACTVCGEKTDLKEHELKGSVIKEATCTETGIKIKSCGICGYEVEETIAAKKHALEKTERKKASCIEAGQDEYWFCGRCGKIFLDAEGLTETTLEMLRIESVGHSYGAKWSQDEDSHYHVCAVCGEKVDVITHCFAWVIDQAATTEATGIKHEECEACGYKRNQDTVIEKLPEKHTHNFATAWKSDTENHWKECECGEKSETSIHTFVWVIDQAATTEATGLKHEECETCGYKRNQDTVIEKLPEEHTHNFATAWKSDTENHWKECGCGEKGEKSIHIFAWVIDQAATTEATGIKHEECEACGYKRNQDTVIEKLPEEHTHNFVTAWKSDTENHWKECECGEKSETSIHAFAWVIDQAATTDAAGLKHEECEACGYKRNQDTVIGKLPEEHTHNFATAWKSDTESHWKECECGERSLLEIHAFGDFTITKETGCMYAGKRNRKCTVCGYMEEQEIPMGSHRLKKIAGRPATCKTEGNIEYYKCSACGKCFSDSKAVTEISSSKIKVKKAPHSYSAFVKEATVEENGSIIEKCNKCGEEKSRTVIYAVKAVILSKTSYIYNGKVQKPVVTIKDTRGKTLKNNTDYTISLTKGMKKVGRYTVTVTLKGNYVGTVKETFDILPKETSISKVAAKKNGFTVKWKKQSSQTTGYEIAYSTSRRFAKKDTKTATVKKKKTSSKAVSKLKAKKKYYVRIRTYKTVKAGGKTVKLYSSWSKVRTVKTK